MLRPLAPLRLALSLLAGCDGPAPEPVPVDDIQAPRAQPILDAAKGLNKGPKATGTTTYEDLKTKTDVSLKALERRISKKPDSWLLRSQAADAYMFRARLTGDYDDYRQAERQLGAALALENAAPWQTRAQLNFTLHRIDEVEADLDRMDKRVVTDDRLMAFTTGLRADVAFQRGQYEAAQKGFEEALGHRRTLSELSRMAVYRWKTGDFEGAEALIDEAEKTLGPPAPMQRAWLHLQRGIMDLERGRYDEAKAHYEAGGELLSGWWLLEEHIAEIMTLQGQEEEALPLYLDLIERTGSPEFMGAAAEIYQAKGETQKAEDLIKRAEEAYAAQLKDFPEAAWGHALGHHLTFSEDPSVALEMAEANHKLRPGGESPTLLAQAYLAADRAKDAVALLEPDLASAWITADQLATAAEAYEKVGNASRTEALRAEALAINPKVLEE